MISAPSSSRPGAFAIWPLAQAAESTSGTTEWPAERPVPRAWVEFDLASPEAVTASGHRILEPAGEGPWGEWTVRLPSPGGLLAGSSFTPWMHEGRRRREYGAD